VVIRQTVISRPPRRPAWPGRRGESRLHQLVNELGALESGLLGAPAGPVAAVVGGGLVTLLVAAASPASSPARIAAPQRFLIQQHFLICSNQPAFGRILVT
jgi:hypothetical protein